MCCISLKRAVHYRILMQALHLAGRFVKGDGLLNCCCIWTNKILLFNSKAFFSILLKKTWYFVTKIVLNYSEKKCSSDREQILKFKDEGREFAIFLRSLKQFIHTMIGQNNF